MVKRVLSLNILSRVVQAAGGGGSGEVEGGGIRLGSGRGCWKRWEEQGRAARGRKCKRVRTWLQLMCCALALHRVLISDVQKDSERINRLREWTGRRGKTVVDIQTKGTYMRRYQTI